MAVPTQTVKSSHTIKVYFTLAIVVKIETTKRITKLAGIYLHIPFCRQACTYCNFHFTTSLRSKSSLVDALCREAADRQHDLVAHMALVAEELGRVGPDHA